MEKRKKKKISSHFWQTSKEAALVRKAEHNEWWDWGLSVLKEKSHKPASVHFKQCYATGEPSSWSVLCINNTNPPYYDIKKKPFSYSSSPESSRMGTVYFVSFSCSDTEGSHGSCWALLVLLSSEGAGGSCSDWQQAILENLGDKQEFHFFELHSAILLLSNLQIGRGRCGCHKWHV